MSFADKVKEAIENAPVATGGTFVQYGKLTCEINVITWKGKGEKPDRELYTEGMEIEKGKQDLEITFSIDVKELNPALQFDNWSRKINVKKSGDKVKTDWSETVLPSLEKVFGTKWADVCIGKITPYVECEQASSQYVKAGAKDYGVPKFLRVFKNKDECIAARNERYGAPEGEADFEMGIPAEVLDQAKGLWKSMKGSASPKNKEKVRGIFESTEPFNEYDADAIFAEIEE